MTETFWLVALIGALAFGGAVAFVVLWRRVARLLPLVDPPPRRPWDPALVQVANALRDEGLTSPAVPRAIAARAPASGVHARDSPPFPEGARDPKRYDVN